MSSQDQPTPTGLKQIHQAARTGCVSQEEAEQGHRLGTSPGTSRSPTIPEDTSTTAADPAAQEPVTGRAQL